MLRSQMLRALPSAYELSTRKTFTRQQLLRGIYTFLHAKYNLLAICLRVINC